MTDPLERIKQALHQDNAPAVRECLERAPELKGLINEPLGPFDSPAIVCVKSRAMLDVLLAAGANIDARSRWWAGGFGLLHNATPELAEYAIECGATVDVHAAARLGRFDRLAKLISGDPALVHARGGDGQTPLHFAGTVEIAQYLLDHGAVIDARDVDHESTPAQYMVRDRQQVVRFLVRRGCTTDLLMASALGDMELVRVHLAADPACIHLSVSDRSFPKRDPRSGGTIYTWTLGAHKCPHTVAREFGHEGVFELLLRHSPPELQLVVAAELGETAMFAALLSAHPGLVRSLRDDLRLKIVEAARNNNTEAVRLMLSAGWPVDVRGQHGGTPLHWAAFHGNADMVALLLPHHPPLEAKDTDYRSTPLGWAIHGSENGWHRESGNYTASVEALLHAGAKPPEALGGSEAVREALEQSRDRRDR